MTSLMQGFAKARQVRIQERIQAVKELNIWRKERSLEFQQQVIDTRMMLATETKNRIALEQVRLATARNDELDRVKEFHQRVLAVRTELEQIKQERKVMAAYDQQLRQQKFAELKVESQEFLATLKSDRLAMAVTLKQELADYVRYIHLAVWGMDFSEVLEASRYESSDADLTITNGFGVGIDEFIQTYIAALAGNPSLVQVVNDRDTVKDLLTTGANTLKVDPSEILNALIKMVDLDN